MKIEAVALDRLTCDVANVRTHSERNLDAIKRSLTQFGQQKPIVVDAKGVVVAGNGTLEAARALGWDKVDVVRTDLKGAEAIAYAIADNRSSELAEWDTSGLAEMLAGLQKDDGIDHLATGFTDDDIENLIATAMIPAEADGKEFDESCAKDVKMVQCPKCEEVFPA